MPALIHVDNNMPISMRLKNICQNHGLDFYAAKTEYDAVSLLVQHHDEVAIVVIDVNLNHREGFRILENIRLKWPEVTVIVLTSLNQRRDFVNSIKLGINDYVLKPFEDDFLRTRIDMRMRNKEEYLRDSGGDNFKRYFNVVYDHAVEEGSQLVVWMLTFYQETTDKAPPTGAAHELQGRAFNEALRAFYEDEDFFMQYGQQSFITVKTDCDDRTYTAFNDRLRLALKTFEDIEKGYKWLFTSILLPQKNFRDQIIPFDSQKVLEILDEKLKNAKKLHLLNRK